MAKWTPISLTGGCVNTREESGLEPGELVSSNHARLKPNDLGQLHRDKGGSGLASTTAIGDIDYISWEASANQTTSRGRLRLTRSWPCGLQQTLSCGSLTL